MKTKTISTLAILALSTSSILAANLLVNGDFEKNKGKNITGFNYQVPAKQKFYTLDTQIKHSGKQSLKISNVRKSWIGFMQFSVKVSNFKKPLKISGFAKYENIISRDKDGTICGKPFIGLWSFTASSRNSLSLNTINFNDGSKDWFYFEKIFTPQEYKRASAHLKGSKAPSTFVFRINVSNQPGTIWFDDLKLSWVEIEEKEITAKLPTQDITENTIDLILDINKKVVNGLVDIYLDNNKKLGSYTLKAGTNKIQLKFDSIKDGKHSLLVKPVKNFNSKTSAIKLNFTKLIDAFAE